ncbi:hypothetical protein [Corynebacterium belfantii]|uniref:Uncharacterized protein n=1 Tax=Corynebacterium belfantii TaxID=2014537 RepID=A0ABS0LES4_9CORY|nr:hypothetical protein [Corynebacterium belfantii]OWM36981.1 hypothetical protein AZF07_00400 [Corynebacterium diphtheriae subsp. lausannense]STC65444.1 Uncharacterised protein [Corynebacterium diphtheriae]MBG9243529.1 hypothetical protein [Corynebacterium belfantii]MBG9258877.1 hypothetical protein [Corynebacterium belfantii]MBG9265555.1 hypothetical protein [Corynebacterium belfantii]
MHIRKVGVTIAGTTMLAGSLATVGSAQATTFSPERHDHAWCMQEFGKDQSHMCDYYNWIVDTAYELRSAGRFEEAEAYHAQAKATLQALFSQRQLTKLSNILK